MFYIFYVSGIVVIYLFEMAGGMANQNSLTLCLESSSNCRHS